MRAKPITFGSSSISAAAISSPQCLCACPRLLLSETTTGETSCSTDDGLRPLRETRVRTDINVSAYFRNCLRGAARQHGLPQNRTLRTRAQKKGRFGEAFGKRSGKRSGSVLIFTPESRDLHLTELSGLDICRTIES